MKSWKRNPTRAVRIGSITIGDGNPIAVQSMTATHTQDVAATVAQVDALAAAGADVVRIAVDSRKDADALMKIRELTDANLSVDLQENYRLAEIVAPFVDKIRYNPGHLYHHEQEKPWQDKVGYLAEVAREHDCAIRVGVNCGSVDPEKASKYEANDSITPMLESALRTLCLSGLARLRPLLRFTQGLRSPEGCGSKPTIRESSPGRAAALGRYGGRNAAGRCH